jgi:hypothetical protein
MIVEWILQLQDYFQDFQKYIQHYLSQPKTNSSVTSHSDIECGDYGELGIYPSLEHFDGEMDDFYIIYCNLEKEKRQINEKYIDQENLTKNSKKTN